MLFPENGVVVPLIRSLYFALKYIIVDLGMAAIYEEMLKTSNLQHGSDPPDYR